MARRTRSDRSSRYFPRAASPLGQEHLNIPSTARTPPAAVLLVEDDADLRLVTRTYLEGRGYRVHEAADGAAARRALDADGPDAVVLDLGLPDERGFDLLRDLRRASDVPILVLTALGEEADRVAGLELGADDYLVKPFSLRELTARIAALLRRRAPAAPPDVLRFGPLQIDLTAREVRETGGPIGLARLEYDLLVYLASTPRRTFTYDQILEAIWGLDAALQDRATVNEHVHRLRRKLPLHGDGPRISTVRGVGYRFDP